MTMRACLLGDSHTAKIIMALREPENPLSSTSFDFVVGSGSIISTLAIYDGKITSSNAESDALFRQLGIKEPPSIHDYDYFVITGSGFGVGTFVSALREADLWQSNLVKKQPFDTVLQRKTKQRPYISRACLKEGITERIRTNAYVNFARQIVNESKSHVFLAPQPRPSDRLLPPNLGNNMPIFRRAAKNNLTAEIEEIYLSVLNNYLVDYPSITILQQPVETVVNHLFTQDKFMTGANKLSNLNSLHTDIDFLHGNTVYGLMQLAQIRETLDRLNLSSDWTTP